MENKMNRNFNNKFSNKHFKGIDANMLRFIAILFMLLDHMWATVIPGNRWMTLVGRIAFPIFAFQITEGFIHTSNFRRYALRLFIFALISEIPFNLFYGSSVFYPFHQNVLFTLLLGLLIIHGIEKARREYTFKNIVVAIFTLICTLFLGAFGFVDYGVNGILTVVAFYVFKGFPWAWIGQLISLILLNITFFDGMYFPVSLLGYNIDIKAQGFAILSLIPIWLYNGKKGVNNKVLQYSFYIFYPLHMLILYLIFRFMR